MGPRRKRSTERATDAGEPENAPVPAVESPVPALSFGRRLAYLSVPFLFFFALLGAAETAVRLKRPPLTTLEVFVQAPEQQRGFRDIHEVNVFEGDPLLFWRLAPGLHHVVWDFTPVTTNAQGLRYPHTVGRKKPGTFRIACFGDSVTFGYRVPTVWPERPQDYDRQALPYPELLEARLRAANPGRDIEVIPLAVPGYSSHQGRAWVERDLGWLEADVVTACYGWNDINLRSRTDRQTMSTAAGPVTLRRLMAATHSQAMVHASLWWQRRKTAEVVKMAAENDAVTRVPADEYVENLREIARIARERGAQVVVLGPVYRDSHSEPGESVRISEHRRRLREAMTAAAVPYLEFPELTEAGWPANERLFGEKIHPGFLGHRLMANRLLETMAARGMLKGLQIPPPVPLG
jgi:lysophospholipase L1-like esterase